MLYFEALSCLWGGYGKLSAIITTLDLVVLPDGCEGLNKKTEICSEIRYIYGRTIRGI